MKKCIKDSWNEFLFLPTQMKVLFVGLCFLILFSISILLKHRKKPSEIEKAKIEAKKDSTILKEIQNEKDSIISAFRRNKHATIDSLYSKHGIEIVQ